MFSFSTLTQTNIHNLTVNEAELAPLCTNFSVEDTFKHFNSSLTLCGHVIIQTFDLKKKRKNKLC